MKYKKPTGIVGIDSYSFKDSYLNSQKKVNLLSIEGRETQLVDIHGLDKAFNSIVNPTRFANSINTVFSSIGQSLNVSTIPITGKPKKI